MTSPDDEITPVFELHCWGVREGLDSLCLNYHLGTLWAFPCALFYNSHRNSTELEAEGDEETVPWSGTQSSHPISIIFNWTLNPEEGKLLTSKLNLCIFSGFWTNWDSNTFETETGTLETCLLVSYILICWRSHGPDRAVRVCIFQKLPFYRHVQIFSLKFYIFPLNCLYSLYSY